MERKRTEEKRLRKHLVYVIGCYVADDNGEGHLAPPHGNWVGSTYLSTFRRQWKHIVVMWNVWLSLENSTAHELFSTSHPKILSTGFFLPLLLFRYNSRTKSSALCHFTLMFIVRTSNTRHIYYGNSYITGSLHIVEFRMHERFKLKFLMAHYGT